MPSLQFCQRLQDKVVMVKLKPGDGSNMTATFAPIRPRRNEISRRCQLDIEVEHVLESGDRLEGPSRLGVHFDINVDRLLPKTQKQGRGPTSEINIAGSSRCCCQLPHKLIEPLRRDFSSDLLMLPSHWWHSSRTKDPRFNGIEGAQAMR